MGLLLRRDGFIEIVASSMTYVIRKSHWMRWACGTSGVLNLIHGAASLNCNSRRSLKTGWRLFLNEGDAAEPLRVNRKPLLKPDQNSCKKRDDPNDSVRHLKLALLRRF